MIKTGLISVLIVAMVFLSCVGQNTVFAQESNKENVANSINSFAFDLYAKLKEEKGNLFFSPYSISTALAMTYVGAKGNTKSQMAKTLHFSLGDELLNQGFSELIRQMNAKKEEYELAVANALWLQEGYSFLKEYLDTVEVNYDAKLSEVDFENTFEASKIINDWCAEKTRGKILSIIDPSMLTDLTRLILTNAIYFKGKWHSPFEEKKTKDSIFTLLSGEKIIAPMMNKRYGFGYGEEKDLQILEMTYAGGDLTMQIFLPRKGYNFSDFEKAFTQENLERWLALLKKELVVLSLPKFKMTSEYLLADTLASLGMSDPFNMQSADFSGMDGNQGPLKLYIDAIIHKTFVEVNEKGTEAAAVTAVHMASGSAVTVDFKEPKSFIADHPFIFIIRDRRSGSILFCGRVMDPR